MDGRHGPVCHSVRTAFPGIDAMSPAAQVHLKSAAAPMAFNRQTRAPNHGRACPAMVGHRELNRGFRLMPAPTIAFHLHGSLLHKISDTPVANDAKPNPTPHAVVALVSAAAEAVAALDDAD